MKFLTGDDIGYIKRIHVESKKVEKFGVQRKGDPVEWLCWAGAPEDREARVGVSYESGTLELRSGANGEVLCTAAAAPKVKCLQAVGTSLLALSSNGCGGIVREWCGEAAPTQTSDQHLADITGQAQPEDVDLSGAATFTVAAPVNGAQVDPLRPDRLAFGGDESDVKIFDLARGEVCWKAKNLAENTLCLAVPKRVNTVSWGTRLAPSRDLVFVGTKDGKIRAYDAKQQRRPLFELVIGFEVGVGTAAYTGTNDDVPRPCLCTCISQVRSDGWGLFVGNNMGILREYDLRQMPSCPRAPFAAGKKAHKRWANQQMPFKRGYKGVMGAIRAIDVHCSGDALVAVSVGRFAYLYDTRKRRDLGTEKVYLKQKLCSVLFSSEAKQQEKDDDDHHEEKEEEEGSADEGADRVQEGFSSDEGGDDQTAKPAKQEVDAAAEVEEDEDEEEPACDSSVGPGAKTRGRKKKVLGRKRRKAVVKASPDASTSAAKKARADDS
mmetsp:Transcript_75362/g.140547  ORF Transcript_75362/g.140547 Transcript_75362/m.140547 type:complete len:494 (+) Transcript_75362:91-1572(+)